MKCASALVHSRMEPNCSQKAIEAAAISQHIADKFLVGAEEDVLQFSTEGDFEALEGPVFVKCFEQWCGHCKSLKPGFVRSATALKQSAKFLEVECSKNDDTKQFCRKHVRSERTFETQIS